MSDLTVLRDRTSSMTDVMRAVPAAEEAAGRTDLRMGVSANVTSDLLGMYLRRHALLAGVGAPASTRATSTRTWTTWQRFAADGVDLVVMLNFFDQLMPAFEARVVDLDPGARGRAARAARRGAAPGPARRRGASPQ